MAIEFDADEIARALAEDLKVVRTRLGSEFVRDVVPRTPVDTGHARRNWQANYGAPNGQELPGVDRSGQNTVQNAITRIAAGANRNAFQSLIIENNVPYIGDLNAGSSRQAPANFVELSLNTAINRIGGREEL